jgi:ADP-dependent NAD(P)H-hydrate dehydratase
MSIIRVTQLPTAPPRPADGHKGTFGRVLVIGGSRGMAGAAGLAGRAALRGGAGLVTVACPRSVQPIVSGYEASYTTWGLREDDEGRISGESLIALVDRAREASAIALGPGLGQSDDLRRVVVTLYTQVAVPMVADADALNLLASSPASLWSTPGGPRILTPHPGECSRLTGQSTAAINADRETVAVNLARDKQVTVLLKGAGTVVTDGVHLSINTTGNSGMATGGSGDVLTGLVAAILAGGLSAFESARLAAHLHGLAGDLAAAELSEPGLIASDLPNWLGRAWRAIS